MEYKGQASRLTHTVVPAAVTLETTGQPADFRPLHEALEETLSADTRLDFLSSAERLALFKLSLAVSGLVGEGA